MKALHNIEKLAGKSHWTGYGARTVWTIERRPYGWLAIPRDYHATMQGRTLADISAQIDAKRYD